MKPDSIDEKLKYHQDEIMLIDALQKYASAAGADEQAQPEEIPLPNPAIVDAAFVHDRRIRRVKRGIQRTVNILAACMALLILGCIFAFMGSAQFRGFLYDQIISYDDGYLSFHDNSPIPEGMTWPAYIPHGFTRFDVSVNESSEIYQVNFQNGAGDVFTILEEKAGSSNIYDYEEDIPSDAETVTVNGTEGYYWRREDINILVWIKDGYFFSITGLLKKAEMLHVAESFPN